jgi:hypothetical protein
VLSLAIALTACNRDDSAPGSGVTAISSSGEIGRLVPTHPVDPATGLGGAPVPIIAGANIQSSAAPMLNYTAAITPEDARAFYEKGFAAAGYTTTVTENEDGDKYVIVAKKGKGDARASIGVMRAGPEKGTTVVDLWLP